MNRRTQLAVREVPRVELLDALEMPAHRNLPAVMGQNGNPIVSVGKIPGEIKEVPVDDKMTIKALFILIGVKNLDRCEIQRNGQEADLDDLVEAGDTVLAIAKIRGNQ